MLRQLLCIIDRKVSISTDDKYHTGPSFSVTGNQVNFVLLYIAFSLPFSRSSRLLLCFFAVYLSCLLCTLLSHGTSFVVMPYYWTYTVNLNCVWSPFFMKYEYTLSYFPLFGWPFGGSHNIVFRKYCDSFDFPVRKWGNTGSSQEYFIVWDNANGFRTSLSYVLSLLSLYHSSGNSLILSFNTM